MFARFETLVFIFATCVLVAVTGYVFFASKIERDAPSGNFPSGISNPATVSDSSN